MISPHEGHCFLPGPTDCFVATAGLQGQDGALYYTTFGLSYAMPDPLRASEGDGAFARRLRRHKIARWIHFVGMASQILLGAFVANSDAFGINRAENYRALQGLATVHSLIGLVTYGSLTYAGAIMIR